LWRYPLVTPRHAAHHPGVPQRHGRSHMKGDKKVIEYLNKALTNELTAINQYWLHYRVLKNWGIEKLAEYERHESIDEMKHADKLADRVLFLEGLPNFQAIHKLKVGETVEEILESEEHHVDFIETQFELIERMGLQNYVQLQSEAAGE
jgi:bacterioferritin